MALLPNRSQNRSDRLAERKAAQDDVFVREVDDAVRQDQLAYLAKRYGIPSAIALVIALLAFGGWLLWQENRESAMEEHSEQLVRAIDRVGAGNLDTASKALDPVIKDGDGAASASARMLRAGIAIEQGRKAEAAALFAAVAADDAAPKAFRDLATVREVAVNFDTMKPEDVVARLKPLAVPGNPWFGSAGELVGLAYLEQGKKDLAGPLFATIAKDEDLPETLRARARQLSGLLGYDAIVDVDKIVKPGENATGPESAAQ